MPAEIRAEHNASGALTITLASLASSTAGVGRQSTLVSNVDLWQIIHVYFKITVGTSPTADTNISCYPIFSDNDAFASDGAGASDAALTIVNSKLLLPINVPATTSDVAYYGKLTLYNPGPEWGVAVVHNTGVNLNSTGSNHAVTWVGENQESQ